VNTISELSHLPPITLISLLVVLLECAIFHVTYNEKAVEFGPTILTTTGIFFTFLGIAIGLIEFDVLHIQDSVPALLDGLKTAFLASVAGVGGALTLKARHYVLGLPKKEGVPATGATVDDLAEGLRRIHGALAGDSDATLVSQLKLMRQDSNDRLDALKEAQKEALLKLSQMGSQALVEALRDVIKDFNARINEQFGENFKHLNEGVAKLLIWQEQHRQHVETMATRLDEILKIAQSTTETHKQVVDQSSTFAKTAAELSALLSGLETQKAQINSYAQSLASLLNSAKDAMPQIESRITGIAAELARAASQNQQIMSKAIEENAASISRTLEGASKASAKAVEEHNAQIAQLVAKSKDYITAIATELAQAASKNQQMMSKAIAESAASISRTLEGASNDSAKAAEEHNKRIAQLVAKSKDQIDLLDAALSDELKKSLEALGGQLAALSEKFVSDYMPLTDRLREIVRIAERV